MSNGNNCLSNTACKCLTDFQLAVVAGMGSGTPVVGTSEYQNDALKGAVNVNFLIVDNSFVNKLDGGFTLDSDLGIVHTPNIEWKQGQTLIIPYSKLT